MLICRRMNLWWLKDTYELPHFQSAGYFRDVLVEQFAGTDTDALTEDAITGLKALAEIRESRGLPPVKLDCPDYPYEGPPSLAKMVEAPPPKPKRSRMTPIRMEVNP